jgi:uncharacterized membrane protein
MATGRLQRIMLGLAALGFGIAAYLTYVHYRGIKVACLAGGGGCEQVQASTYSKLAGIPVATIGLVGYTVILITLVVPGERARLATAGATIVGWAFSAYLTYRELFTIHAICQWCVASAVIMTALVVLAIIRYLRGEAESQAESPAGAGLSRSG